MINIQHQLPIGTTIDTFEPFVGTLAPHIEGLIPLYFCLLNSDETVSQVPSTRKMKLIISARHLCQRYWMDDLANHRTRVQQMLKKELVALRVIKHSKSGRSVVVEPIFTEES